jgi:hypothetical protein
LCVSSGIVLVFNILLVHARPPTRAPAWGQRSTVRSLDELVALSSDV